MTLLLSYLGSAAGGAILKGFFGLFQESMQNKHNREMALLNYKKEGNKLDVENFNNADNYTKHTRRVLAWGMCFTYAAILILWAVFPQVEIFTYIEPEAGGEQARRGLTLFGYSLLGIENPTDLANRVVAVTTGHLVVANTYVLSFILGAYFMPTGRR